MRCTKYDRSMRHRWQPVRDDSTPPRFVTRSTRELDSRYQPVLGLQLRLHSHQWNRPDRVRSGAICGMMTAPCFKTGNPELSSARVRSSMVLIRWGKTTRRARWEATWSGRPRTLRRRLAMAPSSPPLPMGRRRRFPVRQRACRTPPEQPDAHCMSPAPPFAAQQRC